MLRLKECGNYNNRVRIRDGIRSAKSGWVYDYRNSGAKYKCICLQNYRIVGSEKGEIYIIRARYMSCYSLYICTRAFGPRYGGKLPLTIEI